MDPHTLLRPWHKSFRRLHAVEDVEDDNTDVLWLDFGKDGSPNPVLGFMMEGLELLLWLARVSVDDFQDAVDELWPQQTSLEGETSYRFSRCKQIGIALRIDTYNYLAGLGYTSQNLPEFTASRAYVEARGVIKQVLRKGGASDVDSLQKPVILVHLLRRPGPVFVNTVPLIPDAIQQWLDSPNDTQDHEFHLRVTKLSLDGTPINTNDHKLIAQLNELATCGVKLLGSRFKPLDKTSKRPAQARFTELQTLLQTYEHTVEVPTSGPGLCSMNIVCDESNRTVPPGLFSALTATHSLRHISIFSSLDTELTSIESIGLALFSSLARHSIESVTLHFSRDGDLQRLLQALGRDDDPLAMVFEDHAVSIRAHQHERATASRFALCDPTTHVKKNVVIDTHEHKELRIIDYKRLWWCVLLPAWDVAWVHDTDVQVTTVPSAVLPQVGKSGIRKIRVRGYQSQVALVVALVKLMNPSVEDLTLSVDEAPGSDDVWANVVSSFTSLRRLSLDVSPRHLASLVSTIAGLGGHRSLATLALLVRFEGDELHLLGDFIDVLADPSHAISQCLDRLAVDIWLDFGSDEVDALARRFDAMLDSNKRLVTFRLHGETSPANAASSKAFKQVLLAHHGSLVQVLAGSLSGRQKLAFLTTMQSVNRRDGTSSLQLLDSETVSIVFRFAARCRRRTVSVRMA